MAYLTIFFLALRNHKLYVRKGPRANAHPQLCLLGWNFYLLQMPPAQVEI